MKFFYSAAIAALLGAFSLAFNVTAQTPQIPQTPQTPIVQVHGLIGSPEIPSAINPLPMGGKTRAQVAAEANEAQRLGVIVQGDAQVPQLLTPEQAARIESAGREARGLPTHNANQSGYTRQ